MRQKPQALTTLPRRILGIDPGSQRTGYGCVEIAARQIRMLTHGTLELGSGKSADPETLQKRLLTLHEGLNQLIEEWKPHCLVVENVFFAKNALSALKLGQARGVVLLAAAYHKLELYEYSATQIKKSITGHGQADKEQVSKMLQIQFGKQGFKTWDASDGLALAVHHAHSVAMNGSGDSQVSPTKEALKPRRPGSLSEALKHRIKG